MNEGTSFLTVPLAMFLYAMLGGLAMGGIFIGAAVLARVSTRVGLTLLLGFSVYLLGPSQETARAIFPTIGGDFIAFIVIALATLAVSEVAFSLVRGLRPRLARTLDPRLWDPPIAPPLSTEDFAKRWFVTVASATGGLVGNLAQNDVFLTRFHDAFVLKRIMFTLIMTVVSITLIGPVEDYIFRTGSRANEPDQHGGAHSGHFETLLQQMSWRALGRLGLVLVMVMQLNILHASLEETINSGNAAGTLSMVFSSLSPAIVTYFWCAALQHGTVSIARRTIMPATLAGFILEFPSFLVFMAMGMTMAVSSGRINLGDSVVVQIIIIAIISLLGAFIFGLLTSLFFYSMMTLIGGWALDTERRRSANAPARTIAMLTLALTVVSAFIYVIQLQLVTAYFPEEEFVFRELALSLLPTIGWGAGLLVSGFPDILQRAGASGSLAITQAERDAGMAERRRNWEQGKEHVRATWFAQSKAQRYAITAILVFAPLMLILLAVYGDEGKPKTVLVGPDGLGPPIKIGIDNLRPNTPLTFPSDLGSLESGKVPWLGAGSQTSLVAEGMYIEFGSGPDSEGFLFKDKANVTQGALVCDDTEKAEMARVWILLSDSRYRELRDEDLNFIVDGRTIAKKLRLEIDGHEFFLTTPTIANMPDGRTVLTAFLDPDQVFFRALKAAEYIKIVSGERSLIVRSSGNEDKLSKVAAQCNGLGIPPL